MTAVVTSEAVQADFARFREVHRIRVVPARSAAQVTDFINLPKHLFRNQPNWVHPLDMEVRRFLSDAHPFRLHGDAEMLLAFRGNSVVGRVLVSDDPRYNELHGSNTGCFGMFDCIDDQAVANQLLGNATRWLRERGRTVVVIASSCITTSA